MHLVDSHCHLDRVDLSTYDNSFKAMLDAARSAGVEHMLCVSIDLESYPAMLELVDDHSGISVSVGVHPNDHDRREPTVDELVELAAHPRNVAIGETGLDYYRTEGNTERQRERFRRHIRAARAANKPLIVHTREARDDTLRILQEERAAEVGGVLHCFTEDWEMARAAMDLNFRISFSGIVTFKNAVQIKEVAQKMPADLILVETDSPYLAPVPKRGKSNRPAYVRYVAEHIAELRNQTLAQVAERTTQNFYQLFSGARKIEPINQ